MTKKTSTAKQPEVKKKVVVQLWMEAEAGWGTRPDGYSLHKDEAARAAYVKATWGSRPKDTVPDEYSFPSGKYEGEVDKETYELVNASETGLRFWKNNWPPQVGQPAGHFETT